MEDRRRPPPANPLGAIDRLPARILLDRLPVPIWAVHEDTVVYANRAFEQMLGRSGGSLDGVAVADLIDDAGAWMAVGALLRQHADELLCLRHADGSAVKVVVSQPMLLRADEPVVLIGVQDVTAHLWERGC